jgi:pyruvate dehydrogenase E2 component (dihydrolipoamide acetyltransferase)
MAELVSMPKLGFDMAEGTLVRWVVSEGSPIEKGAVLAEIETDKATVEVEAFISGVVHKHLVSEGTVTPVGTPIAVIGAAGEQFDLDALMPTEAIGEAISAVEEPTQAPTSPEPVPLPSAAPEGDGRLPDGVRASPVARRLAADHGVDLSRLSGSGPGGRVVKKDVEAAVLSTTAAPPKEIAPAYVPPELARPSERVPVSKLRSTIGRRMTASKQQVPHFYVTADIDAAPMMAMRAEANALLPEEEKLSVNDFIVKAAAMALRQFPNLNASLEDGEIVRHGVVNVGMAVAVEDGLLTVVIRDADLKPVRLISKEARTMVARAREGRVRPEDIEGSTFTVSNMGMFDVDHFIAIINPPEAAILAIGSVDEVPVVDGGEIVSGFRFKCTLSADHRVTDGAEAAQWLQVFRSYIELPLKLML